VAEGGSGLRGVFRVTRPCLSEHERPGPARGALFTRRIRVHDRDWFGCVRFGSAVAPPLGL